MNFKEGETISSQIVTYMLKRIFSGELAPKTKLPPIRELALELQVNPYTIVKAYGELETQGLIYTESTAGKYVTGDVSLITAKKMEYIGEKTEEFIALGREVGLSAKEITEIIRRKYND